MLGTVGDGAIAITSALITGPNGNGDRVLVKGKCSVSASTETASTSSVGHDATVELSDVAGRNVLGIRSGIISDQTALRTLQNISKHSVSSELTR